MKRKKVVLKKRSHRVRKIRVVKRTRAVRRIRRRATSTAKQVVRMTNPLSGATKIYAHCMKMECMKGVPLDVPGHGHINPMTPFVHKFSPKHKVGVYGLKDGSVLLKSSAGIPLWKNYSYGKGGR